MIYRIGTRFLAYWQKGSDTLLNNIRYMISKSDLLNMYLEPRTTTRVLRGLTRIPRFCERTRIASRSLLPLATAYFTYVYKKTVTIASYQHTKKYILTKKLVKIEKSRRDSTPPCGTSANREHQSKKISFTQRLRLSVECM